ncbi:MerR family transcriptional regulator, heat shock protein HspR [Austwickia chelonae]|uniref:Putative MerR family transcriptional regulator n=1 Tax=Austwickia chelonae NBRC 105200 TaxID=1184607 RepID=K6VU98_9MICO|nr:MerR family transcriptional regulator [Austwickia chelonae]GAB78925.1 putative MerR family transcriptional regulator [Austwickia chelonae NBRC 105200]SEV86675.1 MerR family transcriptional regulator, heat shock protein HspR [Austwickia chelonae]
MNGRRRPGPSGLTEGAAPGGPSAVGAALPRYQPDEHSPVFVISVAAQLAGMHAQTLRQYDRLGIVIPRRTRGGGRRYSQYDIAKLREVQRLSQEEGVSLAGVRHIMAMADEIDRLRRHVEELTGQLEQARRTTNGPRVFAAGRHGDVVAVRPGQRPRASDSRALVVWRPPVR